MLSPIEIKVDKIDILQSVSKAKTKNNSWHADRVCCHIGGPVHNLIPVLLDALSALDVWVSNFMHNLQNDLDEIINNQDD